MSRQIGYEIKKCMEWAVKKAEQKEKMKEDKQPVDETIEKEEEMDEWSANWNKFRPVGNAESFSDQWRAPVIQWLSSINLESQNCKYATCKICLYKWILKQEIIFLAVYNFISV